MTVLKLPPPQDMRQEPTSSRPRAQQRSIELHQLAAPVSRIIKQIAFPSSPCFSEFDGTNIFQLSRRDAGEEAHLFPPQRRLRGPSDKVMASTPSRVLTNGIYTRPNGINGSSRRGVSMSRDGLAGSNLGIPAASEAGEDSREEEDPVHAALKARWHETESRILALFSAEAESRRNPMKRLATSQDPSSESSSDNLSARPTKHIRMDRTNSINPRKRRAVSQEVDEHSNMFSQSKIAIAPRKAARVVEMSSYDDDSDEDDRAQVSVPPPKPAREIENYDDDSGNEEETESSTKGSALNTRDKGALPNGTTGVSGRSPAPSINPPHFRLTISASAEPPKSSEDVRKQLEEDKKAAAEAAKRTFQSMFFTLEYDRDAMLEQQKLDDLDREVDNEISGASNGASSSQPGAGASNATHSQGTLGSTDLGASSLTLKHLIQRIDQKRDMVKASDSHLRTLISEVRKGRSKWASEDRHGQEELYEAAEKVLMELKAMNEYVQPFLQRVSKREAPDYQSVIRHPMDIGLMMKKLKQYSYKSKKEFVDDLNLIWSNCLRYNQDPAHPLRKKALHMRKETDKLTPLIPDITVRDRAEVEAEERRNAIEADDSDEDDAPIMASRGRKAPKKGLGKSGPASSKRPPTVNVDETASGSAPDANHAGPSLAANLRHEETQDASSTGFSTPPPGNSTPLGLLGINGVNGIHGSGAHGSQADVTEADGVGASIISSAEDADEDDTEFKAWKQVTKRDRAKAASERYRLFHGEQLKHLNTEEPALLRSKAGMRRWMRQQKMLPVDVIAGDDEVPEEAGAQEKNAQSETLAEGIEKDEDSTLPDYYTSLSAIPDIPDRWQWITDSEGYAVPQSEEGMRLYPRGQFVSPVSTLTKKMDANVRQMQETRKVCYRIGVVKQMQIQAQTYASQFQKYEPQPFVEQDIEPTVVSEDGPIIAPVTCRAAFKRSIGKIFYHAGFEDFQPSAMETMTDVAADYFTRLVTTFKTYRESSRKEDGAPRFTFEEQVLHALDENGLDLETLETYVTDDVDRLGTKLGVMHERMTAHLKELIRPALGEQAGADGAGAFNDGSEQFLGGDFAEDLGEDFFGFRELGLTQEFGLESLSVPLHLLQSRVHNAYQTQNQGPVTQSGLTMSPPEPYEAITTETLPNQIGLVQDFFRQQLRKHHDEPLVEDDDLPQKQRFPKPRLPPTGKISSPRKRPIREQQQAAKKKRKLEESEAKDFAKTLEAPTGKLRLEMPETISNGAADPEKDGDANGTSLISPESITGN